MSLAGARYPPYHTLMPEKDEIARVLAQSHRAVEYEALELTTVPVCHRLHYLKCGSRNERC